MMILQFIQIKLTDTTINIVSNIPQLISQQQVLQQSNMNMQIGKRQRSSNSRSLYYYQINLASPLNRIRSLSLLRHLSQLTLSIQSLYITTQIINHYQEQILIKCDKFDVINWSHPSQEMIKAKGFILAIKVPFTLEILESVKNVTYDVKINVIQFITIPKDYQMVIHIIGMFNFKLQQLQNILYNNMNSFNKYNNQKKQLNQHNKNKNNSSQNSFNLQISHVNLTIKGLYECDIDQKQAQQYLSNISEANFTLNSITFSSHKFFISQSTIRLSKYQNLSQSSSFSSKLFNLNTPMISIPELMFIIQQKSIKVFHNPTELFCGREELALLGKLFILINDRMKGDQFNAENYTKVFKKFVKYAKKMDKKEGKIIKVKDMDYLEYLIEYYFVQQIEGIGCEQNSYMSKNIDKQQNQSLLLSSGSSQNIQSVRIFLYQPPCLTFHLILTSLPHTLTLTSSSYKQLTKPTQLQHILFIPSLQLSYKQLKQFGIKQLKLIFRQIPSMNELALSVENIIMKQNQETLIDYLNGWVVIKKVLQINEEKIIDSNKQDNNNNNNNLNNNNHHHKYSKKNITIRKIQLEYQKDQILIKKFQLEKVTLPNQKISKLYFSLDRCQFNIKVKKKINFQFKNRIFTQLNNKNKQKNVNNNMSMNKKKRGELNDNQQNKVPNLDKQIQTSFTLFCLQSFTLSTTPCTFTKKISPQLSFPLYISKSLLHLKSPRFILPYFDISLKIHKFLKQFSQLQSHINAFITNKTEDEFVKINKNMKEFIVQTQVVNVKVTNIEVIMEQNGLDIHMENYNRFIMDYIGKKFNYNNTKDDKNKNNISEIQIISFLKKNKQQNSLCKINIKEISFELYPVYNISNSYKQSVNQWIMMFRKKIQFTHNQNNQYSSINPKLKSYRIIQQLSSQSIRLRRVNAGQIKFSLKQLSFTIKDYPFCIVQISSFSSRLTCLRTLNIFNLKNYFFSGELKIGLINLHIGLNMLSGFMQIYKHLILYINKINEFQKSKQFVSKMKTSYKAKKQQDKLKKQKMMQNQYQPWWHMLYSAAEWRVRINKDVTKICLYTGITPYDKQCFNIVLGNFQCVSQLNSNKLKIDYVKILLFNSQILSLNHINTFLSLFYDQNMQFHINFTIIADKIGKIIINKSMIEYITKIKQFRSDWLIIYGLYLQKQYNDDDDQMIKKKQKLTYLEFINLTANKIIQENGQNSASFLTVLKEIKLMVKIPQFHIVLTNNLQGIQFISNNFNFDHQIVIVKKIKQQWQTLKSYLFVDKIWGALQQKQSGQPHNQQQNIFMIAKRMKFNFNQYKMLKNQLYDNKPNQIVFIRKLMTTQAVQLVISMRIKRQLYKLILSFSPQTLHKQFQQKTKPLISSSINKLDSTQRFKNIVLKIIRINKLKRRKLFGIKNYLFFSQINKIQIILKSNKNSVIITSKKNIQFNMAKIYQESDKMFNNPINMIFLGLKDVEISFMELNKNKQINNNIMNKKQNQKLLKFTFCQKLQLQIQLIKQQQLLTNSYLSNPQQTFSIGKCLLQNGSIQLTSKTKQIIQQLIQFMILFTHNRQKKKLDYKKARQKYMQLQNNGRDYIKNKLQWNFSDMMKNIQEKLMFQWGIQLKNVVIRLIVPIEEKMQFNIQSSTFMGIQISKPFLKIQSSLISSTINFYNNQKVQRKLQINDLTVENLLEKQDSIFRKALTMNHQDRLAIFFIASSYELTPISNIIWDYIKDIRIHVNPIKIRINQLLYKKFYQFLFPDMIIAQQIKLSSTQPISQPNAQQDSLSYQQKLLPDYIKKLQLDQIKVQIWYDTESIFKKMDGISVGLKSFVVEKKFSTKKQLFDQWIKFLVKQIFGQVFNVIGQKMFGGKEDDS